MKKLLSLLAIGAITSTTSIKTISCNSNTKINIADKKLTDVSYSNNEDIYNNVRTQIGSWAKSTMSASTIKNDTNIIITIYQNSLTTNEGVKVDENAVLAVDATKTENSFYVTISVNKSDQYFQEMSAKKYELKLSFIKVNIENKHFKDSAASDSQELFDIIYEQIASWISIQGVDKNYVQKWNHDATEGWLITVYDRMMDEIDRDYFGKLQSGGIYEVSIEIHDANPYLVKEGMPLERNINIELKG